MKIKPTLYIPDYEAYGDPFKSQFKIVYDPTRKYDIDLMKSCDFLMLTGGADIDPSYYGQEKCSRFSTYSDKERDQKEFDLATEAIESNIPIIGICRGAQWLSILAGGSLIQHVDGHIGAAHMLHIDGDHEEYAGKGRFVYMSTDHHQMVNLTGVEHILHAWTNHLSSVYLGARDKKLFEKGLSKEPEVFYIPVIRGFGIQGHPEYLSEYSPGNVFVRRHINSTFLLG